MAYWIDESAKVGGMRQLSFFVDKETDVASLPDSTSTLIDVGKGSKAFCIETGNTYYLDSDDSWVLPGDIGG